jgi:hypothetical protein
MRRRNAKNAHERVVAREGLMVLDPTLYKGKWNKYSNYYNLFF